ncbi:hypothetical protein NHX12_027632, partial [Muraenolepis orangiensis]
ESEILNTAVLTGRTVAVPVKVVTVGTDGTVSDITESVECRSADEQVIKVSERCDYVYVNGKETRGRTRVAVNFTYSFLSAQLEMSVWMPRLPLLIDVSDPELSQIKGWRVPVATGNRRYERDFLLGTDWQVDVTHLVAESLKVKDPKIARFLQGQVLMGLSPGTTKLSPGSNRAIVATATTQEVITQLKQESLISAWLQFSDGSTSPLDNYDPAHFLLTATSLDERVVAVQRSTAWKWPVIVAKGEGHGLLVRVELTQAEACQKARQQTALATAVCSVRVRLGQAEDRPRDPAVVTDRRGRRPDPPPRYRVGPVSDTEAGIMNRAAAPPTARAPGTGGGGGGRLSADGAQAGIPGEFSEQRPGQPELVPRNGGDDEPVTSRRGSLTDLEIGMYALLGVFCLAILVFLINCISYAYRYRSKHLSLEGTAGEAMPHAHDWVWLGQEDGLCLQQQQQQQQPQQQDEMCGTLEEGSQLLNGGFQRGKSSVPGGGGGGAAGGCVAGGVRDPRSESLNSPTTKRKRVKFTTFSSANKSSNGIKWVCPDIELGNSQDLRNYMDRLNENAA